MNLKRYRSRIGIIAFIFLNSLLSFANSELTFEELKVLRKTEIITQEEYEILVRELRQGTANEKEVYTLKVGELQDKNYTILHENGKIYFDLQSFIELIQLKNYVIDKNRIKIYLGTTLDEIILDIVENKVYYNKEELEVGEYPKFIVKTGVTYVESEVFEKIFLNYCEIDNQRMIISWSLNFTPPMDIGKLVEINKKNLEVESKKQELIFTGKREFFNLGYLDLDIDYYWDKEEKASKYEKDWTSDIGYQGGLFYGEFSFDYDLRENEMTALKLEYDELIKEHDLEITRSRLDSDGLWGVRFYKDRGYYEEDGRVRIIESVPLGSRVELLYMGVPIEIQDEVNGRVEFTNELVRSDREYQLKIYYPDGRIEVKTVVTTEDYHRQRFGEIEYDITFDEIENHSGFNSNVGFYYGVSNNLTLGFGVDRELTESKNGSKKYIHSLNGDFILGNTFNGTSYILKLEGEQALDNFRDSEGKKASDKSSFGYLGEVARDKWKVTYEEINYGKYYSEKRERELDLSYDINRYITLDYIYRKNYDYDGEITKENILSTTVDYNFQNLLVDTVADFNLENSDKNSYEINVYWRNFENWTTRLENRWENNGKDYEVALEIYNNNFGGYVDVSAEVRYSDRDKESVGLKVNVILDGWLTFDTEMNRDGKRNFAVGVDRIIDLKNPKERLYSADVSRANIVTFIDENNNNVYDEGEESVDAVEIETGNKKIVTDKNGRAKIYGLSNGIYYELKPKIKKPSYSVGENEFKIMSKFSSDVDVHIPIKPMVNLSGYMSIAEDLNISPEKKDEFYSNIIVQILDKNGKEIELSSPDNTGYFDISGLYSEEYIIKIYYIGEDLDIPSFTQKLKLEYKKGSYDYEVKFDISKEKIKIIEG